MGYRSGAPPWVYKQREASLSSSYESQIAPLQQRIKELDEENSSLKRQLEAALSRLDDVPRDTKGPRVFVDAKIIGRHDTKLPKRTMVAYFVEGRAQLKNATEVKADETDDAELHAIAFAIHDLKDKLAEFTVICDNESVVSVITTENQKTTRKRPILSELLAQKREHSGIKVELLESNPAHKFLNKWISEHPTPLS